MRQLRGGNSKDSDSNKNTFSLLSPQKQTPRPTCGLASLHKRGRLAYEACVPLTHFSSVLPPHPHPFKPLSLQLVAIRGPSS